MYRAKLNSQAYVRSQDNEMTPLSSKELGDTSNIMGLNETERSADYQQRVFRDDGFSGDPSSLKHQPSFGTLGRNTATFLPTVTATRVSQPVTHSIPVSQTSFTSPGLFHHRIPSFQAQPQVMFSAPHPIVNPVVFRRENQGNQNEVDRLNKQIEMIMQEYEYIYNQYQKQLKTSQEKPTVTVISEEESQPKQNRRLLSTLTTNLRDFESDGLFCIDRIFQQRTIEGERQNHKIAQNSQSEMIVFK